MLLQNALNISKMQITNDLITAISNKKKLKKVDLNNLDCGKIYKELSVSKN
jgi:hypothetical protein